MKKRKQTPPVILTPSENQLHNCKLSGWKHLGSGIFEHVQTGMMGMFTPDGFRKE